MIVTIHLHGIARQFGEKYDLDVKTSKEAINALGIMIDGFADMIRAGEWHVLRGPMEDGQDEDAETIEVGLGSVKEIHLLPAIKGSGGGGNGAGIFTTILGIVMIVVGIVGSPFTGGSSLGLTAAGVGMLVGGIVMLTTKIPGADTDTESMDDKASFLFSGPKNQSSQGVAIPRGYGRVRTGSIVISAGLFAEQIASTVAEEVPEVEVPIDTNEGNGA